jgi:hypothetical protein
VPLERERFDKSALLFAVELSVLSGVAIELQVRLILKKQIKEA